MFTTDTFFQILTAIIISYIGICAQQYIEWKKDPQLNIRNIFFVLTIIFALLISIFVYLCFFYSPPVYRDKVAEWKSMVFELLNEVDKMITLYLYSFIAFIAPTIVKNVIRVIYSKATHKYTRPIINDLMFYFMSWFSVFVFFFAIEYILGNIVYLIFIDLLKFSAPNPIICSCIFNFILGIVANVLLS